MLKMQKNKNKKDMGWGHPRERRQNFVKSNK